MSVNQRITPLGTIGHRGVDSIDVFVEKTESVLDQLHDLTVGELNIAFAEIDLTATQINNAKDTTVTKADQVAADLQNVTTLRNQTEQFKIQSETAKNEALAIYDNFDDRYLGAKSTQPTTDNDGDALNSGDLYYNSSSNHMYVYDGLMGIWVNIAYVPTLLSGLSDISLSGLSNGDTLVFNTATLRWENKPINKTLLGLGNVQNIAPEDMPLSLAEIEALALKLNISDTINTLESDIENKPLSAKQGKVLKGFIDGINALLTSDDTSLDQLQEIVAYIKANRDTLNSLAIANISGLSTALSLKANLLSNPYILNKLNSRIPLFQKVDTYSIKIPLGNTILGTTLTADVTLSLNSNLDTGTKQIGLDYFVYARVNQTYYISRDMTKTDGTLIGGFHYGLTPVGETPTGNKTTADITAISGINAYTLWDLKLKPSADVRGKFLKFGKWHDIYPMDSEYAIRKWSSPYTIASIANNTFVSSKIAGGATDFGRGLPLIPLEEGGDGVTAYTSFTAYKAHLVGKVAGCETYSFDKFPAVAYGVAENESSDASPNALGDNGTIRHFAKFTSKYGMEMATGVQWWWGQNVGGNYGTTDFAWRTNTESRGQIYSTSNNPTAVVLGGYRGAGALAGSRCSYWYSYVWDSNWSFGCRFTCDSLELV